MAPIMAAVLAARGDSALVFRGDDGLDELTTATGSHAWVVNGVLEPTSASAMMTRTRVTATSWMRRGNRRHSRRGAWTASDQRLGSAPPVDGSVGGGGLVGRVVPDQGRVIVFPRLPSPGHSRGMRMT